jgi:ABC transporter fused permease/ATP-binding protein
MARHRSRPEQEDLPPARFTRETLREGLQLAGYLWPYRLRFALAMLALFFGSLMALTFPAVAGSLVDGALPVSSAEAVRPWLSGLSVNAVAGTLLLVLAIQAFCSFWQAYGFNTVGERALADVRRDTYVRLIRLPMTFHNQRRVGELSSRLAADLSQISDTVIFAVPQLARQVIMLLGGVVLIILTSARLALVMLASVPLLVMLAVVFGRFIRRYARSAQDRLADSNVIVEETLQGVATVKAFANEGYEEGRYRGMLDRYLVAVLAGARYRGLFFSFIVFGLFGSIVLVLWYGARMLQAGELSAGLLASFMLYTLFVGGAMGSFAELYSQAQRTLGATQRIRELLREPTEEAGSPPADLARLRGEVAFDHVTFRYPSRKDVEVLRGVTLRAAPGQRIALVGPSGAGKSTLVSLLLRFYDPDGGRVLLDGRDAHDYPLAWLRSQMAVVPQDVLLFGGSIRDNIAYGRPGASEEEVIEAAKKANAHDFISAFPEGYRTLVGERGVQLSGGQRQRVAIARAILRDPAILILDEATSALDSENEALVLQALDRLMEGRTSLVIAHRLSTVRRADRIIVLKDGQTVEEGTHEELLTRSDGVYRTLTEMQLEPA